MCEGRPVRPQVDDEKGIFSLLSLRPDTALQLWVFIINLDLSTSLSPVFQCCAYHEHTKYKLYITPIFHDIGAAAYNYFHDRFVSRWTHSKLKNASENFLELKIMLVRALFCISNSKKPTQKTAIYHMRRLKHQTTAKIMFNSLMVAGLEDWEYALDLENTMWENLCLMFHVIEKTVCFTELHFSDKQVH